MTYILILYKFMSLNVEQITCNCPSGCPGTFSLYCMINLSYPDNKFHLDQLKLNAFEDKAMQ